MTKSAQSHILALSAWTLKKATYGQLPGSLSPDYKKSACKANSSPTEHSLPNHT